MGKAVIVSHAGKGLYTVDLYYDSDYIQGLINRLEEDYARLQFTNLIQALDAQSTEYSAIQAAASAVDVAILEFNLSPTEENRQAVEDATITALQQSEAWITASTEVSFIKTRMDAIRRRIDLLKNNSMTRKRTTLWCADLADGKKDRHRFLPGDEVGVIEFSGQDIVGQALQPSYVPATWPYTGARDGRTMNIAGMTHFEVFYNLAIFPGWQKWRHRYRTGVITGGTPADGWDVTLDVIYSSELHIPVNLINGEGTQIGQFTGIDAVYLSCDNEAFAIDDHVVLDVSISGTADAIVFDATIIGFVEKPKPCFDAEFAYYLADLTLQEYQGIKRENGAWTMKSPHNSDLVTDIALGTHIRQWIGEDNDNEPIILESKYTNASRIYWSGKKLADAPTDQTWYFAGFGMTPSRKYLYAVMSYSAATTEVYVARLKLQRDVVGSDFDPEEKTVYLYSSMEAQGSINGQLIINDDTDLYAELKAQATVDATLSVVKGWEITSAFDMGTNAQSAWLSNQTNIFNFNESCTQAISMMDFVHGAKRTPQATPAGGAEWHDSADYNSYWKEKITIDIVDPDATTLSAATVTMTNHGRQGAILREEHSKTFVIYPGRYDSYQYDAGLGWIAQYAYTRQTEYVEEQTLSGTYQIAAIFNKDEELPVNITASGTLSSQIIQMNYPEIVSATGNTESVEWETRYSDINNNAVATIEVPGLLISEIYHKDYSTNHSSDEHLLDPQDPSGPRILVSSANGTNDIVNAEYSVSKTSPLCVEISRQTRTGSGDETSSSCESIDTGKIWCRGEMIANESAPSKSVSCYIIGVDSIDGLLNPAYYAVMSDPNDPYGTETRFDETILYDITELTAGPFYVAAAVPTNAYADSDLYAAISPNGRVCASWETYFNATETHEYASYLTDGDLSVLDGATGTRTYLSIHTR